MSSSLRPHRRQPTRLLCPWDSPGKNTGVGSHFPSPRIFLTQGLIPGLWHCRQILYRLSHQGSPLRSLGPLTVKGTFTKLREIDCMHACTLSRFSHVQLCATLWTAAHQAPLSTGFSRQEYWSGLPFPSPGKYTKLC